MEPDEPSFFYRLVMALLYPLLLCVVIFYLAVAILGLITAREDIDRSQLYSMGSSVRLVGVKGLQPALAPGAASLAFDLLVRIDNGIYEEYCGSVDVTVSYAGVPLARGDTPSFRGELGSANLRRERDDGGCRHAGASVPSHVGGADLGRGAAGRSHATWTALPEVLLLECRFGGVALHLVQFLCY
ncbi:unnamed protein product [Urochloa humidicola]